MEPQIRSVLGQLQDNPEYEQGWAELDVVVGASSTGPDEESLHLLARARTAHAERDEWEAALRVLDLELRLAPDGRKRVALLSEQARIFQQELIDEERAVESYRRLHELQPSEDIARVALAESEERRARWTQLVDTYLSEADSAPDAVYKASMLMRAAELELRFAGDQCDDERVIQRLEQSQQLDPTNEFAARMLERIYRRSNRHAQVAQVLQRVSEHGSSVRSKIAAGIRLARLYRYKLEDPEQAAAAYQRVLTLAPRHPEAIAFMSEVLSATGRIDDIVKLYEKAVEGLDDSRPEVLGDLLQLALLHYKTRGSAQDAEPWFERIRKIDPANQSMLEFFKHHCAEQQDEARWLQILQAAQRALPDGPARQQLTLQLAALAGSQDPQKATEHYKSLLRQDPEHEQARTALKRLYASTGNFSALIELLRQELERTELSNRAARLEILQQVAAVYRDSLQSDTGLVGALNQILQIDENNSEVVRELIGLYDKLRRYRDLLAHQQKLARLTDDPLEKRELLRAVGRRWLEQFSNVQNATTAYEELLELAPEDEEARTALRDLYKKRRAWAALFSLYEKELELLTPEAQLQTLEEMARLAAERLGRPEQAAQLYKRVLEANATDLRVLDSLEKQAERGKDYKTLADALEKRVDAETELQSKLVVLQKLGGVYSDHLNDAEAAARTWRKVLQMQPGHARAMRVLRDTYLAGRDYEALEGLYESQGDLDGLAEVLNSAAERAEEAALKVELSYRAAHVYQDLLQAPDRALRSYERVLSVSPQDEKAALALLPIYLKDGKFTRLVPLYEMLVAGQQPVESRLDWLAQLVDLSANKLGNKAMAVEYAKQAYSLAPTDAAVLHQLEEACRAANGWQAFVEALERRISALSQAPAEPVVSKKGKGKKAARPEPERSLPSESRQLRLKIASVYASELGQTDQAVVALKRLVEKDPTEQAASQQLEQVLRSLERKEDLRWLFELRAAHAGDQVQRVDVLRAWAKLEEEVLEQPQRAAELYGAVLELEPSNLEALEALPRLLVQTGQWDQAAAMFEQRRLRAQPEEQLEIDVQLAQIYWERLKRPGQALQSAVRGMGQTIPDPRVLRILEELAESSGDGGVRRAAAEALIPYYESHGDVRQLASALSVELETATDPTLRLQLIVRLADLQENQLKSPAAALETMRGAVRSFPERMEFWDRAERLTQVTGRVSELADAYRDVLREDTHPELEIQLSERAARLHEDLGDPIGAVPYLERVLRRNPASEEAYLRLKQVLTNAEQWGELDQLYAETAGAVQDPTRRLEILSDAALVAEEITDDVAKAIGYYESILEIDPEHLLTLAALDRLYARKGEHKKLAALLERRFHRSSGDQLDELKVRYARLKLESLHEPEGALAPLQELLERDPNHRQARELAEELLEIGSLRLSAAKLLEPVYEIRDDVRELVKVLNFQLAGSTDDEGAAALGQRVSILRRLAQLHDERLKDDPGALSVLGTYLPLAPDDREARQRVLDVASRLGQQKRAVEILEAAAGKAEDPAVQAEILMQCGDVYFDVLGDADSAATLYRRVRELSPEDVDIALPAARALERIYLAQGRNAELVDSLRVQIDLELDPQIRRRLLGRVGELAETALGQPKAAIDAWRARLADDPTDDDALRALDRLYQLSAQYAELVQVLERRRERSDAPRERRELMERVARLQADRLHSNASAIETWRTILEEAGPDPGALRELSHLLEQEQRWEDLASTLEQHIDATSDVGEQLEMLCQMGTLFANRLGNPTRALEAYRDVVAVQPEHAAARQAMEQLLGASDRQVRHETAQALGELYRAEGAFEKLLRVLEVEIDSSEDDVQKLKLLEQASQIAEDALDDGLRALRYVRQAVRLGAGHAELGGWIALLDRLSLASAQRAEQVQLLRAVFADIFDGEVLYSVALSIAAIARNELHDDAVALEYFLRAHELRPEAIAPLAALEEMHAEAQDWPRLLEVLERRAEVTENEAQRKALMVRRAELLATALGDVPGAVSVYQSVLDLGIDHEVCAALAPLLAKAERWNELLELYQRQADDDPEQAAAFHVRMAGVAGDHLQDVPRALDELEQALTRDPQYEPAIERLEHLLEQTSQLEYITRAAEQLEPIYLARGDYARVMRVLQSRLKAAEDPILRVELLKRLAQLHEEQAEDYMAALNTLALLLHEDPNDTWTIGELERLAAVAEGEARLAEIYAQELEAESDNEPAVGRLAQRAGELYRELGQFDSSLKFYRRALALDPESRELFASVDDLLKRAGDASARIDLYRTTLDYRVDPGERIEHLLTIAQIHQHELKDNTRAIDAYREVLEHDSTHTLTLNALTELLAHEQRYEELADLYQRRAEETLDIEEQAAHRLELARLLMHQLPRIDEGIGQLEEIVGMLPRHPGAILELEQLRSKNIARERVIEILRPLYEAQDDWEALIRINGDRLELAPTPFDRVAVLRETSELWERRAQDMDRARAALAIAIEIAPDEPDLRENYERLCRVTGHFSDLVDKYEHILASKPGLVDGPQLLLVIARVHDQERDDPRRALAAYERLRQADETNLEVVDKMEEIATLLSDWETLVRVLSAKAELVYEDDKRGSLWRRVGEIQRDMLERPEAALMAYEKAIEFQPDHAFTLDCLIELYERPTLRAPSRLVELYQRVVDLAQTDDETRFELLIKASNCYRDELNDAYGAVGVLGQALSVKPGDLETLVRLDELFTAQQMWIELLDNLRAQAEVLGPGPERIKVGMRIAGIHANNLDAHQDAVEAYRAVLEQDSSYEPAQTALIQVAGAHEDVRLLVAEILVPVLENSGRHDKLIELLELRLSVEDDAMDRAATLGHMARLLEHSLNEPRAALGALLRAMKEQPARTDLHQEIERLARQAGGFAEYAAALAERAVNTFDAEVSASLYATLGRLYEQELDKPEDAVEAYGNAASQAGDKLELLTALERMYVRLERPRELHDVLERLIALVPTVEQPELQQRMAEIQMKHFGDGERALVSLRNTLEHEPGRAGAIELVKQLAEQSELFEEAAQVLEDSFRATSDTRALAGVFELRLKRASNAADRLEIRQSLARVLEQEVGDTRGAQTVIEQALAEDLSQVWLLDEIERLASASGEWRTAADVLDRAMNESEPLRDTAQELALRLSTWYGEHLADLGNAERVLLRASRADDPGDDVLERLEGVQRAQGKRRELASTLRRRAQLSLDGSQREQLLRDAVQLAVELEDPALAESMLRELLEYEPSNVWALSELTALCKARGALQDAFELLLKRIDLGVEVESLRELRWEAAKMARTELDKIPETIALYQQLFDDDPTDRAASAALLDLYREAKSWSDLRQLLERLIDLTDEPGPRNAIRMELVALLQQRFEAADEAIDLLWLVLDEEPGMVEAVSALCQLLEQKARYEDLAELLEQQITLAQHSADAGREIDTRVRLGQLLELKLDQPERAVEIYGGVLEREPAHPLALEALVRLHRTAGDLEAEAQVLRSLMQVSEPAQSVQWALQAFDAYQKLGQDEEATRMLEQARTAVPGHPQVLAKLRDVYVASAAWEPLASLLVEQVATLSDPQAQVAVLREAAAIHRDQQKSPAQAAELLERASRITPSDRALLLELCEVLGECDRAADAVRVLEQVVESYGGRRSRELGDIHRRLARAHTRAKDYEKATEELEKARRIEPGNLFVLSDLVELAFETADLKKAQQVLRALLLQRLEADSPLSKAEVFYKLGLVHHRLGENDRAIQMLERALQTDRDLEPAKLLLREIKA